MREYPTRGYQVIVKERTVKGILHPSEVIGTYTRLSIAADIAEKLVHNPHKGGIEREVVVWNQEERYEIHDTLFTGCMCR